MESDLGSVVMPILEFDNVHSVILFFTSAIFRKSVSMRSVSLQLNAPATANLFSSCTVIGDVEFESDTRSVIWLLLAQTGDTAGDDESDGKMSPVDEDDTVVGECDLNSVMLCVQRTFGILSVLG
jgi:hypothetical protein